MYMFYERLRLNGYQALLYCPLEHLPEYEYIDTLDAKTLARDIVVYPEIVWGNPLRFQHVTRLVLYFPGALAGETSYHPSERVFTWGADYYPTDTLYWSIIDQSLFCDENLPKTQDCYFINKKEKWGDFEELRDAVEINMHFPASREELAQLLKTTRILYNFDTHSSINEEALRCGAQVKIITEGGINDFHPRFPGGIVGESLEKNMMDNFISISQNMEYSGPLQDEEPFLHHYTGIFYHAAARCAALGAWEEALNYCRKAYLGNPLKKPDFAAQPAAKAQAQAGKKNKLRALPGSGHGNAKDSLQRVMHYAASGRYTDAERVLAACITQGLREGNMPTVAAYLVLLAHCYEHKNQPDKAADAERLALLSDPRNTVAAHLAVARALTEGKLNQALFAAVCPLAPHLTPLDTEKAFPGLALLGLIAAKKPDKTAIISKRLPDMLAAAKKEAAADSSSGALKRWKDAFAAVPLGAKLLG